MLLIATQVFRLLLVIGVLCFAGSPTLCEIISGWIVLNIFAWWVERGQHAAQ